MVPVKMVLISLIICLSAKASNLTEITNVSYDREISIEMGPTNWIRGPGMFFTDPGWKSVTDEIVNGQTCCSNLTSESNRSGVNVDRNDLSENYIKSLKTENLILKGTLITVGVAALAYFAWQLGKK